jgi:hypothetical protein
MHPWMFQRLVCRWPVVGTCLHQQTDKVDCFIAEAKTAKVYKWKASPCTLVLKKVIRQKRCLASHHLRKGFAHAPDVCSKFVGVPRIAIERNTPNFWSLEKMSAEDTSCAKGIQAAPTKPKVAELYAPCVWGFALDEDILAYMR